MQDSGDQDTGLFKTCLKDYDYPKDEKNYNLMKKDCLNVLKDFYKDKLLEKRIKSARDNLDEYIDELEYDEFKDEFPEKNFPANYCNKLEKFCFGQKVISEQLGDFCEDGVFKDRKYPKDKKVYAKKIQEPSKKLVKIYFKYLGEIEGLKIEQGDVDQYLEDLNLKLFRRRFGKAKDDYAKKLTDQIRNITLKGGLEKIGDFLEKNIALIEYPNDKDSFKELRDTLKGLVKDYASLALEIYELKKSREITELYLTEVTSAQFKKNFKDTKKFKKQFGKKLKEFVKAKNEKEFKIDLVEFSDENATSSNYPGTPDDLKTWSKSIVEKLDKMYKETIAQKEKNFQYNLIKTYWNEIILEEFQKFFKDQKSFKDDIVKGMKNLFSDKDLKALSDNDIKESVDKDQFPDSIDELKKFKKSFLGKLKKKVNNRRRRLVLARPNVFKNVDVSKISVRQLEILENRQRRLTVDEVVKKTSEKIMKDFKAFKGDKKKFEKSFDQADEMIQDMADWLQDFQKHSKYHIKNDEVIEKKLKGKLQYPEDFDGDFGSLVTALEKIVKKKSIFKKMNSIEWVESISYAKFKKLYVNKKTKATSWKEDLPDDIKEHQCSVESEKVTDNEMEHKFEKMGSPKNEKEWKKLKGEIVTWMKKEMKGKKKQNNKEKDSDKETKSGEKNETKEKSKSDDADEEKIRVRRTKLVTKNKEVKNLGASDFEVSEEKARITLDSYLTRDTSGDKNWANYGTNNDFVVKDSDDTRSLTKDDAEIKDDAKVEDDKESTDKTDRAMSKEDIDRQMKQQNISVASEPEEEDEGSSKDDKKVENNESNRNLAQASASDIFDSVKQVKSGLINARALGKSDVTLKQKRIDTAWKRMEKRLATFNLVKYIRRRLDVIKLSKADMKIDTGDTEKTLRRLYEKTGVDVEYDESKEGNLLENLTQGGFSNMNVSAAELTG